MTSKALKKRAFLHPRMRIWGATCIVSNICFAHFLRAVGLKTCWVFVAWKYPLTWKLRVFCGCWMLKPHAHLWSRPFFGGFWGWRQVVNWMDRVMIMTAQDDDDDYYYCDPLALVLIDLRIGILTGKRSSPKKLVCRPLKLSRSS